MKTKKKRIKKRIYEPITDKSQLTLPSIEQQRLWSMALKKQISKNQKIQKPNTKPQLLKWATLVGITLDEYENFVVLHGGTNQAREKLMSLKQYQQEDPISQQLELLNAQLQKLIAKEDKEAKDIQEIKTLAGYCSELLRVVEGKKPVYRKETGDIRMNVSSPVAKIYGLKSVSASKKK